MLVNVIKEGDVVTVRLSTGEELIGTLVKDKFETDNEIVVSKPMVVGRGPDGNMGLIPFMMTSAAEKFTLRSTHVMGFAKTEESIAKLYSEQTSSIVTGV